MTEERKLAQEERALRAKLKRLALELVAVIDDPGSDIMDLKEHFGALVRWESVVKEGDVAKAFWDEIRGVAGDVYWRAIEGHLLQRDIIAARVRAERLVEFLDRYEELFGLRPPEEEEAPEEEPIEEPSVKEGTPLAKLGLSNKVYNALCRSKDLVGPLGLIVVDSEGYEVLRREPYVEEVLSVLETRGEKFFLGFKNFGEKALKELKEKLREKGFLPKEPEAESFTEALGRIQRSW